MTREELQRIAADNGWRHGADTRKWDSFHRGPCIVSVAWQPREDTENIAFRATALQGDADYAQNLATVDGWLTEKEAQR